MAAPYVGNQDYRGYLNYLGKQGNQTANQLLGLVGNDGQFDPTKKNLITDATLGRVNSEFMKQYSVLNTPQAPKSPTSIPSLYGGGGGAPPQVYAPKLDIAATQAKARAAAEGAVNPYYTKVLGDFLARQAAERARTQTQYETNTKNLDDNLANTLEGNEQTKTRTGEDVATNIAEVNQTADEFQTDSGQEFDQARLEIARQASTGGLGAQKTEGATKTRNTQEGRQVQKFEVAKQQQELFKTRTFEDLAKSSELAKTNTEKGKKQAKFDLDSYIESADFEEKAQRNSLEQDRLQAVAREQGNQGKLLFNQYLAGISNPAQLQAAVGTYGGSF